MPSVNSEASNHFTLQDAFEESLRIGRTLLAEKTSDGSIVKVISDALERLGQICLDRGMLEEARAKHEESLGILRRVHGEKHPDVAGCFQNIANVLTKQGNIGEALKMQTKAVKLMRRTLGENHQEVAANYFNIDNSHTKLGNHAEGLEMYEKSIAVFARALGVDCSESAMVYLNMSGCKIMAGDLAGALESVREAVRLFNKHGVNNAMSQGAKEQLKRLEIEVCRRSGGSAGGGVGWLLL